LSAETAGLPSKPTPPKEGAPIKYLQDHNADFLNLTWMSATEISADKKKGNYKSQQSTKV
jgi:hypothetical protein